MSAAVQHDVRPVTGNFAAIEGVKYGLATLAITAAATVGASRHFAGFNKYMSISAKVSLPLMASLGVASYRFETVAHDVQVNPERYGFGEVRAVAPRTTPIHHKILNSLNDHPFRIIAALGVPFAGYILKQQMALTHMKVSQRIMHSRVIAQFGVLSILIATMGFKSFMDAHGRFPDPDAEAEEEAARNRRK